MPEEEEDDVRLSERDMRAMAMAMALKLPRNEEDARRVLELVWVGYEFFLCEAKQAAKKDGKVVRPRFSR